MKGNYSNAVSLNKYYPDGRLSHSVGDLRYTYTVIPTEQYITVFANLKDGTIYNISNEKASVAIYYEENIDEVLIPIRIIITKDDNIKNN